MCKKKRTLDSLYYHSCSEILYDSLYCNISLACGCLFTDTNLEVRPFLTQDSDLLVKSELPEDTEISEAIRVRVRLTPETDEQPVEFNIDGKFVGVTTLYLFIPASAIPKSFRQFFVQVSLLVDNVQGPFNPAHMTQRQFINLDPGIPYILRSMTHQNAYICIMYVHEFCARDLFSLCICMYVCVCHSSGVLNGACQGICMVATCCELSVHGAMVGQRH